MLKVLKWIHGKADQPLFGQARRGELDARARDQMQDIQTSMLNALGDDGRRNHPRLTRMLQCATEPQTLWYARADLMSVLASRHGERKAGELLAGISVKFNGLLPTGLTARPAAGPPGR